MAMDGRSVVVVDCDLRKPSMHTLMGTDREVGFTSVVTGACTLREAVVPTATEGLSFLPTGPLPPNPTEVLNSQASRNVLATLAEEYDVVLVDCPPSTGLSDIQVIAQLIDGLLLVVSMDQTLKTQLGLTIRTLAQAEAPLIGLVVNRLDMKRQGNYYYYYYAEQEGADRKTRRGKKDKAA
jgi:receptor protein-tyrosine kinase